MATSTKRLRRLWDAAAFPGFRPRPTVRGVFGDPKACIITLERRSKQRSAAAVVEHTWAGTTGARVRFAICPAAIYLSRDSTTKFASSSFENENDTLDRAQRNKCDHICRKLRLEPGERLLDIGCGWGALVRWAASGRKVT